ncbi:hypothetical protein SAMN04488128_1011894 [Chitinophaga eiseniae]|uniref:Uncharacterized protein n=1 Tax=Chitinophaga eiseniae TaxID=634771 RepID=A0A1T4P3H3_9BACT|nr:hypothetical protein [Chitinophaga eiseniae]SJZ86054.1 hypothetical protein SAMN04488128_1011894 [Chitinophaga eiseniae]
MEHVWNALNYLIAGYVFAIILFIACHPYVQALRNMRMAYLITANKAAAVIALLKAAIMLWLMIEHGDTNHFFLSYPPLAVPQILCLGTIAMVVLLSKRFTSGLSFVLLMTCLILINIIEYNTTQLLAAFEHRRAVARLSRVPYPEVITTTILYFTGCYIYARRKTDGTPSS